MLNKRVCITTHVLDRMVERNFAGETKRDKIKRMILTDLRPMNIKRIEKSPQLKGGKNVYFVWTQGGREYRLVEKGAKSVTLMTGIQHNRESNKYANIKLGES